MAWTKISIDSSAVLSWGEQLDRILKIVEARIAKRCPTVFVGEGGYSVLLSEDASLREDGFCISKEASGTKISASTPLGLIAAFGKLLRTSGFSADGWTPSEWTGISEPDSPVRGIQMDSHFCNFYHMASEAELRTYVEDLALWGVNCIDVVFPLIDLCGWEDPEVAHITGQIAAIYNTAKAIGVKVGLEIVPNQDFVTYREEFKATPNWEPVKRRGNNGHNICPNKPGALEYITTTYRRVITHLKENGIFMDFICFWPYDEGGCGCDLCRPWGSRGYLKASRAIRDEVVNELPDVKVILSTWLFDTPDDQDEWSGLSRQLDRENGWVDYILADSHTDFPTYPLTHPVPGNLPLLNYPEISMWQLYPWGGYGANPLPERFERLWNQVKDHVNGGIAYSEGIFDDLNKVVVSQFYWNRNVSVESTVREYLDYELIPDVYEKVRESIRTIENNHVRTAVGAHRNISKDANTQSVTEKIVADAKAGWLRMREVDETLPVWAKTGWRWRILYIRSYLDYLRFSRALEQKESLTEETTWVQVLKGCPEAKEAVAELVSIYHSNMDYDDSIHPMFRCVRPALKEL